MPIRVRCQACGATLTIPEEFAGKKAQCGSCSAPFRVPSLTVAPQAPTRRYLDNASIEEMLAELHKRGVAGVLAIVDVHQYDLGTLAELIESGRELARGVNLSSTEQLSADQLRDFITALGGFANQQAAPQGQTADDAYYEPFDFKGDKLGMSLGEFKQKYARQVPGTNLIAPFCSDKATGFRVKELLSEAWHTAAGIIHARLEYPSEERPSTIAGAEADLVLYQFLDGRLFQVSAWFAAQHFPNVASALRRKYGPPETEGSNPTHLAWKRIASSLEVTGGRISPAEPATFRIYFDDLVAEATSREPRSTDSGVDI